MKSSKFVSIHTKLTTYNAVLIVVIVFLVESMVYTISVRHQIADAAVLNQELTQTMSMSFDDMNNTFIKTINFATMGKELQENLQMEPTSQVEKNARDLALVRLASDYAIMLDEVRCVFLYDKQGQQDVFINKRYATGEDFSGFSSMHPGQYSARGNVTWKVEEGYLVFRRMIRDIKTLETLGYLSVVYEKSAIQTKLNTVVSNEHRFLIVMDEYGSILTHNCKDQQQLQSMLETLHFSDMMVSEIVDIPGYGNSLVTQYSSSKTGYRTVSAVAVNQIIRSSNLILGNVVLIGIVSVAGCILVQFLIANKIVGPLNRMAHIVKQVKDGDFMQRVEISTNDELGILSSSFNHMLEHIDTLINQSLRDEIKFKEMQLKALHAQINPHLLYNTLECINWLAELGRKEEIRRVTISFSNIMKSLVTPQRTVSLVNELKNAEDFLSIYQTLLGDRLEYSIDADPRTLSVVVPRLTLQPIIENAVLHGVKKSTQKGIVQIQVSCLEFGIIISVSDNGVGIPSDVLQRLNAYIAEPSPETDSKPDTMGLGIKNVVDRLYLTFQGKSQIHITSRVGWGTTVDVSIPTDGKWGEL